MRTNIAENYSTSPEDVINRMRNGETNLREFLVEFYLTYELQKSVAHPILKYPYSFHLISFFFFDLLYRLLFQIQVSDFCPGIIFITFLAIAMVTGISSFFTFT